MNRRINNKQKTNEKNIVCHKKVACRKTKSANDKFPYSNIKDQAKLSLHN